MIAHEDKTIDQAISSAWQLTEDERVRQQMLRRIENEMIWADMEDSVKKEKEKVKQLESEIQHMGSEIQQKDDEIQALKKVIEQISEQLSEQTAKDMLMDNEPLEKIIKYSHLPEDIIVNLAASMGVMVNR